MDVIKDGYLIKKSSNRRRWKTRWFVLHENMFMYYRKRDRKTLVGSIKLDGAAIHYPVDGYEKRKGVFKISVRNGKVLLLQAATHDDRDVWTHTICALIRSNEIQIIRSNEKQIQRQSQIHVEVFDEVLIGDLLQAMQDVAAGVKLENKFIDNVKYECTFSGSHLIDWLLDWSFAQSRPQGAKIGKELMRMAHILTCSDDFDVQGNIIDSNAVFYRFSHLARNDVIISNDLSSSGSSSSSLGDHSDGDCLDTHHEIHVVKEGILMKKSLIRNIWKSRRVLLYDNPPQLHLYGTKTDKNECDPLKVMYLKDVKIIDDEIQRYSSLFDHIKKKRDHIFGILKNESEISFFQAENNFEKLQWTKLMKNIVNHSK